MTFNRPKFTVHPWGEEGREEDCREGEVKLEWRRLEEPNLRCSNTATWRSLLLRTLLILTDATSVTVRVMIEILCQFPEGQRDKQVCYVEELRQQVSGWRHNYTLEANERGKNASILQVTHSMEQRLSSETSNRSTYSKNSMPFMDSEELLALRPRPWSIVPISLSWSRVIHPASKKPIFHLRSVGFIKNFSDSPFDTIKSSISNFSLCHKIVNACAYSFIKNNC